MVTDAETYRATVAAGDPEAYKAGLYDEFIRWLDDEGIRFIHVHTVYKSATQLASFHRELVDQALEMIDPGLPIYKSPGRFSCGFCAFREPCIDKDQGGDYEYALKTMYEIKPRYYALAAASTDRGMNN